MARKRQYRKNTDPDSCLGYADEQTSSKWASKLVKPAGGRCSGRVHATVFIFVQYHINGMGSVRRSIGLVW